MQRAPHSLLDNAECLFTRAEVEAAIDRVAVRIQVAMADSGGFCVAGDPESANEMRVAGFALLAGVPLAVASASSSRLAATRSS